MPHEKFIEDAGRFQAPEALAVLVGREQAGMTREEFFTGTGHQPVFDAWNATAFGLGYQTRIGRPVEVRLSSHERFPDFQLRVEGATHDFEAVMIMRRRLGQLFKGDKSLGALDADMGWDPLPLDREPLRKEVRKKAMKHYQGTVHLLVYLGSAGAGGEYEVLAREVTEAADGAFESIWMIVWGREAGTQNAQSNMISCAKTSAVLADAPGWLSIPMVEVEDL